MAEPLRITVRDNIGPTPVNGTAATVAFTSDPIPFNENTFWSLNVWFTGLLFAGQVPQVTIEVSNSSDVNSFRYYGTYQNINVPEFFEDNISTFTFWRVVYDPKGATGGTKNFDLIKYA